MTTSDTPTHFAALRARLAEAVLGQPALVDRLLVALLADGHLLVEGLPGLAKTRAVKRLAALIDADFHRIQFTPDLLPADLTGSEIFRPQDGSFRFEKGPLFHQLLLADEINRAPAKVQSALLEAMEERQVTIGQASYPLPPLFMVIATQNPIEHEGTYPLPEAQLDRFLLHVRIDYPPPGVERDILRLARDEARAGIGGQVAAGGSERASGSVCAPAAGAAAGAPAAPVLGVAEVLAARRAVLELYLSPDLEDYLLRLVAATRAPQALGDDLAGRVRYGASPRAAIGLERAARAHAWLAGRDYVSPHDIQSVAPDVLRHRLILGWEAQADGDTPEALIAELIARVAVP